jgi:hypothetical protein
MDGPTDPSDTTFQRLLNREILLRGARKKGRHTKRRPFVSASLEPQAGQRGQKPLGVAKSSKTETFRRCRI